MRFKILIDCINTQQTRILKPPAAVNTIKDIVFNIISQSFRKFAEERQTNENEYRRKNSDGP